MAHSGVLRCFPLHGARSGAGRPPSARVPAPCIYVQHSHCRATAAPFVLSMARSAVVKSWSRPVRWALVSQIFEWGLLSQKSWKAIQAKVEGN